MNVTQQPGYFLFKEGKAIKSATKGFTLIEMAMVLLIIGLLAKTAIAPFGALLAHNKREQAQSQLHQVKQAVFAYVVAYGALPCPMSRSAVREPAIIAGATPLPLSEEQRPCLTSVGFVPTYAMGLVGPTSNNGALLDPWGRELLYSVSLNKSESSGAQNVHYWTTPGAAAAVGVTQVHADLVLCHRSAQDNCRGKHVRSNQIAFVLMSSGSDASASGWQAENLDDDNFFTYTDESIVPGEQFDDLLVWGSAADTLYWMLRMGWLP